jgi:signal transduction histidine kinase
MLAEAKDLSIPGNQEIGGSVAEPDIDGLVHDLRGPLSVIVAFAESLDGVGREERARFAERLVANAHRALAVLEEFSALCALRSGEAELTPRPMDLGEIVQRACENIAPDLRRGIEISCIVPQDGVLMIGDRDLLGMAVRAVLRKSARELRAPRALRVVASGDGDFARLELQTVVAGDREAVLAEIDVDDLEILRRVAAMHAGRLIFDRQEPDVVFRVSIPRQPR